MRSFFTNTRTGIVVLAVITIFMTAAIYVSVYTAAFFLLVFDKVKKMLKRVSQWHKKTKASKIPEIIET